MNIIKTKINWTLFYSIFNRTPLRLTKDEEAIFTEKEIKQINTDLETIYYQVDIIKKKFRAAADKYGVR